MANPEFKRKWLTNNSYLVTVIRGLILIVSFEMIPGVSGESMKPELEIGEVVIEASAPILTGGDKDPVTILETQASATFVNDTVQRLSIDVPELIPAPDQPVMEARGGCMAPFLGLGNSVKSRMIKAGKAWNEMRWQEVIDQLTPVATDRENIPEKPEAFYFIGRSKHYLGDISGAANAYEQLRFNFPDHPYCEHAFYALGWIYFENGSTDKAMEILQLHGAQFPVSGLVPYIRYLKAAIQNKEGKYSEALENLEGIIAGYPLFDRKADVQFWLAENQYYLKNFDRSLKNYSLYLGNYKDGDKRAEALYGRAFTHIEMGNHIEALQDFTELLETNGTHELCGDAAFQAGKIAVLLDDKSSASRFFQQAIQLNRDIPGRNREARGWIQYETGNYDKASVLFEEAASEYPARDASGTLNPHRAEMMFLSALSCFKAGKYGSAAETFENLARETELDLSAAAMANAGVSWLKLQRLNKAWDYLQKALAHKGHLRGRDLYTLYAAEVLFRLKRYPESIGMFNELQKTDEADQYKAEIIRGIAWNYYAMENWGQAAEYFGQITRQFPGTDYHAEALLRRAESLFNNSEYDSAKAGFNALIQEYPLHPEAFEARLLNARADWVRGEYERGMQGLKTALRFAPDGPARQRVHMTIGELLQEQGRYEEAIESYREAFMESPGSENAAVALLKQGDNLYNLKRYDESAQIYQKIISSFPESELASEAQYSMGLTYFQQDRLDEYIQECLHTAELHPGKRQSALALNGAAAILMEQNRLEEAIAIQRQLLVDYGQHVDDQLIRFRLARNLLATGDARAGTEMLEELIKMSPGGRFAADARMELAAIAVEQGELSRASEMYQVIMDDFPYHPRRREAMQLAARVMVQRERWDVAEALWLNVLKEIEDGPETYEAHGALSEIYMDSKRFDEAMKHAEAVVLARDRKQVATGKLLIAKIYEMQGDIDTSLTQYLKIGYLYPDQTDAVIDSLIHAASILNQQKKNGQRDRMLAKAVEKADTDMRRKRIEDLKRELGLSGGSE